MAALGHNLNELTLSNLWWKLNNDERILAHTWYKSVNTHCIKYSLQNSVKLAQYCGIVAVLSPGLVWERNIEAANTLIAALKKGLRGNDLPMVTTYSWANIEKAENIFLNPQEVLEYVKGPKVLSFYHNILNPEDPNFVTIDRHAVRAAHWDEGYLSDEKSSIKHPRVYIRYEQVYKLAAKRVSVLPNVLQAGLWEYVRNNKPKELVVGAGEI